MGSLLAFLVFIIYVGGAWKFLKGFHRTNFSQGRFYLALLWPVFLLNKPYRQNFMRALKGG